MSCWKDGSPDSPLLIVGMAPGHEELEQDLPFVGPSGRLLWTMLKRAGIDRADCYILNVIGEWPASSTGAPTPAQLEDWWDRFDSAVHDFTGRVAFVLGGDALYRFTGLDGGVTGWGGYLLSAAERRPLSRLRKVTTIYKTSTKTHKKGDERIVRVRETVEPPAFKGLIIPALHPAGVLRTGLATAPILASQCRKVGRALNNTLKPYRTNFQRHPIIWAKPGLLAVDIETGGIDNGINRIGMARDNDAFSIPWSSSARATTAAMLANPDTTCIYHNGGFDIPRLEAAGCKMRGKVVDTMMAAALLQPDLPKGLNACGSMYLDVPRWKHLDEDDPTMYNALDAVRTYELWEQERELLSETGQLSLFTDTIMAALPTLINMGTTGIRLDTNRRDAWLAELGESGKRMLADWNERTGGTNPNSPMQLKQLFSRLGMSLPYNKDGGESVDQLALSKLKADYPEHTEMLNLLQEVKRTFKDMETYALVGVGADGRVHPSFVPAYKDEDGLGKGLAGTWRITAKDPNLQNQPTRARKMYCPSPGHVFVGADYSQLEARILAWLSGDKVLLEDCDAGIHARNAERLGVDKTRAKNGFYGWGYLAGAKTLQNTFAAKGFKIPMKECEALLAGFDNVYKTAASFRKEILSEAQARRYVQNPFGLRRYFPHAKWPAPSAMSTHIQSTGAIMMWRILPQLEQAALSFGGRLLLSVHDDILMEVPEDATQKALAGIVEIMEQKFPEVAPGFYCPVTPKYSDVSWGDMQDVI